MRITKVYTRTGDAGKTRLAGGQSVWKDSLRVEAYGTVDELNASVGVVRVFNGDMTGTNRPSVRLEEELRWIQNKLFDVGGILATAPSPPPSPPSPVAVSRATSTLGRGAGEGGAFRKPMPQVTEKDVTRLEKLMDECHKDLAPLKEFILPGGGKVSGLLHHARTVCRRAERVCVRLSREEQVDPVLVKFLNRLGDALFVLARWVAKTQGEPEFLWERDLGR